MGGQFIRLRGRGQSRLLGQLKLPARGKVPSWGSEASNLLPHMLGQRFLIPSPLWGLHFSGRRTRRRLQFCPGPPKAVNLFLAWHRMETVL